MRQGGEPQGVQIVRQGEPTPYHCDFNPLSIGKKQPALPFSRVQAAFFSAQSALFQLRQCALHFGHLLFQLRQFGFVDFHFQHQARAVADGDGGVFVFRQPERKCVGNKCPPYAC